MPAAGAKRKAPAKAKAKAKRKAPAKKAPAKRRAPAKRPLLSNAEYAAHRRRKGLPGKSRQAVENALRDGRIRHEDGGGIDPVKADRAWKANTDTVRQAPATAKLADARAEQAQIAARRARLELEEREGQLVRVEKMAASWFELARRTRDRLLLVGARIAGEIALEDDPRACQQRIDAEIREALEGLTDRAPGRRP